MSASSWIPTWSALLWTAAYTWVLAVHLRHSVGMAGRRRLWHATHVLMALGMIDMFWPGGAMVVGPALPEVVYLAAACGVLVLVVGDARRHRRSTVVWPLTAVDLLAMAYMFAIPQHGDAVLSTVLAAWFAIEAIAWAAGPLAHAAERAGVGWPEPEAGAALPARPVVAVGAAGPALVARTEPAVSQGHHERLDSRVVRATLSLMSLGMGYMILAMQFGMASMSMHGMSGM
ncbi:MAG TPA: DUF5134 domain-containing protein [Acidimicrobiales bacterium]|nr:DUF5134 domain-containing protein [Actinomycetes bacterium]HVN50380.1 DUF5134 domain-containing protein [Acidimicrobiales bacterium]